MKQSVLWEDYTLLPPGDGSKDKEAISTPGQGA